YGGGMDEATFENNLATYYDNGGRVVVAMFKLGGYPSGWKGAFDNPANPYMFFQIPAGMQNYNNAGPDTFGAANEPGSPLLNGVAAPTSTGWETALPIINGGVVVATWKSGRPMIVRGVVKGRKRVDINMWCDPANFGGDGINIIRNALLYQ